MTVQTLLMKAGAHPSSISSPTSFQISTELQVRLLRQLHQPTEVAALLNQVVEAAHLQLQADACSIFVIEPDGRSARQRAGTGYQAQFVGTSACRIDTEAAKLNAPAQDKRLGITGWCLSTGRSFLAQTQTMLREHPHHLGINDKIQLPGETLEIQSFLCIPFHNREDMVIGVIKAERRAAPEGPGQPFSSYEQIVLEMLGRVVSKCWRYCEQTDPEQRKDAITAWARSIIAEAMATEGELDSFLSIVAEVTAAAMDADSCGIYLTDTDKKTLTQRAGSGSLTPRKVIRSYALPDNITILDDTAGVPNAKIGLTAWIALKGELVHTSNLAELKKRLHHLGKYDDLIFPKADQKECGAFLGIPLQVGGATIGVLKVENAEPIGQPVTRDFIPDSWRHFELIGQDIALMVERLREQLKIRYDVINRASPEMFEILRGRHEQRDLVRQVVEKTKKLFNARACALFLKDGDMLVQPEWAAVGYAQRGPRRTYKLVALSEIKEHPNSDTEKVGLTVYIACTKQPYFARSYEELKAHPHHRGQFDLYNFDRANNEQCESFMGVPLVVGNDTIGVLKVETKISDGVDEGYTYFTEQEELVFKLIANSVAIAIENARMWEVEHFVKKLSVEAQLISLLPELHHFVADAWHAADTLRQAAGQIQDKFPAIARIISSYASLIQPNFTHAQLREFLKQLQSGGDLLVARSAVIELYSLFDEALAIFQENKLDSFCKQHSTASTQLSDSQFFLRNVAEQMASLCQLVHEWWQHSQSRAQLREQLHLAAERLEALPLPEREIMARIVANWIDLVNIDGDFVPVQYNWIGNPYSVGAPILPGNDQAFFGRQDVLQWLTEELRAASQPPTIVLHGVRRIGKTSLLRQLEGGKFGAALREGGERPIYPVWVNLGLLIDPGMRGFLYGLALVIARSASLESRIAEPSKETFEITPGAAFDAFLDAVSAAITPGLLVLMFDEYENLEDRVVSGNLGPEIYEYLRHQIQVRPNVSFILAGARPIGDVADRYRTMIYTMARHHEISYMAQDDTRRLVTEPVASQRVMYDPQVVERIWQLTHGHPYFVQLLCHSIIGDMNRRADGYNIREPHLDAAVEQALDGDMAGQLNAIWWEVTAEERAVLAVMANQATVAEELVSALDIVHMADTYGFTDRAIVGALRRLVSRHLVLPSSPGDLGSLKTSYCFAFDLLRLWIARVHALPFALLEVKEQYCRETSIDSDTTRTAERSLLYGPSPASR